MDNLEKVVYSAKRTEENSGFCKGYFEAEDIYDTFLKPENFKKGFVTINGFNIGRYWEIGPQGTLYVPASLLKKGKNEVVIFESDSFADNCEIEFCDTPCLDINTEK